MAGLDTEENSVVDEASLDCPYCGENISVLIDSSVEEQEYYEDCSVCCVPILFLVTIDVVKNINLIVKRDDE